MSTIFSEISKALEHNFTAPVNNVIEGMKLGRLIRDRANAIRAKNVEEAVAIYATDPTLFDVINPLQYTGRQSLRERAVQWFSSFHGPIGYELRDLTIEAGDDVAFSHSLNRVRATTLDGKRLDMWWRATVGYRKVGGEWKVTHEHNSVPFDLESGKAALDLKP